MLAYKDDTGTHVACTASLKPETFEGLRFDFSKPLNQNFALTHQYVAVW